MKPLKPKAFIFDFDGVIADTEATWFECILSFAERHRLPSTKSELEAHVGDGDTVMMDILAQGLGSRDILNSLYHEMQEEFWSRGEALGLNAGITEYLDFADGNSIILACASNSHSNYVFRWLTKLGIIDRFKYIVTRDDIDNPAHLKPYPDIYLKTLSLLEFAAEDCISFEDSLPGLECAAAAGVPCARIPGRYTDAKTAHLPNLVLDMSQTSPEKFLEEFYK